MHFKCVKFFTIFREYIKRNQIYRKALNASVFAPKSTIS